MGNRMAWLSRGEPEWERAWSNFPDRDMHNAEACEVLQYMGTVETESGWVHEFRHRAVPGSGERRYWKVPASPEWAPAEEAVAS